MAADLELWRRRLSDLGRGAGKPHPPLFAPLLYGAAAQIDAFPVETVVTDPTKLCKGLTELRRILGTRVIYGAAPMAMEAEALGATVERGDAGAQVTGAADEAVLDIEDFEESWARSAHLAASLEATRRLAAAGDSEYLLFVALTGPLTLLDQLFGASELAKSDDAAEFAGRALAALLGQYAQAGVAAVALYESCVPESADRVEYWDDALGTIANVARFHRIPLLLVPSATPPAWPDSGIACASRADQATFADQAHGLSLPAMPAEWGEPRASDVTARVIVTAAEVPAQVSVAELREHCAAMVQAEAE